MGLIHSPSIVSDGLVLALDAQNSRSYGGSGTTWTDVSYNGNNGTLTNGPTFEPGGPFAGSTGGSVYFDGTGDRLTISSNSAFDISSGAYTVELYVNFIASPSVVVLFGLAGTSTSGNAHLLYSGGVLYWQTRGTSINQTSYSWSPSLSQWYHLAVSWNGSNSLKLFIDGVEVASNTVSPTINQNGVNIGGASDGYSINGFISNLRIIKGTALYTSNFTPPTKPLTPVSGTSLLTCQGGAIVDNSSNKFSITKNGDARAIQSASIKFDGTNDYVTIGSSPYTGFGTDDFTIESWVYLTSNTVQNNVIYDCRYSASATGPTLYYIPTTGLLMFYNGSNRIIGGAISINTWTYVAMIRKSGYTRLYINATQVGSTYTDSNNYTSGVNNGVIGAFYDGTGVWNGNISNTRVYKGKGLTAEEVQQNFNALRGRFGV